MLSHRLWQLFMFDPLPFPISQFALSARSRATHLSNLVLVPVLDQLITPLRFISPRAPSRLHVQLLLPQLVIALPRFSPLGQQEQGCLTNPRFLLDVFFVWQIRLRRLHSFGDGAPGHLSIRLAIHPPLCKGTETLREHFRYSLCFESKPIFFCTLPGALLVSV